MLPRWCGAASSRIPHGSDQRARPSEWLCPATVTRLKRRSPPASDPKEYIKRALDSIATHVGAMLELKRAGAITFDYGNNIRRMAKRRRERRVRNSRLCARIHTSSLLRRPWTIPLGRAIRRPRRHRRHGRRRVPPLSTQRIAHALDQSRAGTCSFPGIARAYLLARLRRARASLRWRLIAWSQKARSKRPS